MKNKRKTKPKTKKSNFNRENKLFKNVILGLFLLNSFFILFSFFSNTARKYIGSSYPKSTGWASEGQTKLFSRGEFQKIVPAGPLLPSKRERSPLPAITPIA